MTPHEEISTRIGRTPNARRARNAAALRRTLAFLCLLVASPAPALSEAGPAEQMIRLGVPRDVATQIAARWEERHPGRVPARLLESMRRAAEAGAPVDLVAGKAVEGLAKGVPDGRLLPALDRWGDRLASAAHVARDLRRELRSEGIGEREAVLRLSVLQRAGHDEDWLNRLRDEARASKTGLGSFLRVGEAVTHLSGKMGLSQTEAENLGRLFMRRRVRQEDIGKVLRAIEFRRGQSSVAEAARSIHEQILRGATPDEVLRAARGGRLRGRSGPGGAPSEPQGESRPGSSSGGGGG